MKLIRKELLSVNRKTERESPLAQQILPFHPLSGIFDRGKYTGNTVFKTIKLKPFIIHSVIHMF